MKIGLTNFSLRQVGVTKTSAFGGYTKTTFDLIDLLNKHADRMTDGDRPYVKILHLSDSDYKVGDFITTFAATEGSPCKIVLEARRPDELPVPVIYTEGTRLNANAVDIILYSREQLDKEGAAYSSLDPEMEWFVVSINCLELDGVKDPINPFTMMRNYYASDPTDPRGVGGSPYPPDMDLKKFIDDLYVSMNYWMLRGKVMV